MYPDTAKRNTDNIIIAGRQQVRRNIFKTVSNLFSVILLGHVGSGFTVVLLWQVGNVLTVMLLRRVGNVPQ